MVSDLTLEERADAEAPERSGDEMLHCNPDAGGASNVGANSDSHSGDPNALIDESSNSSGTRLEHLHLEQEWEESFRKYEAVLKRRTNIDPSIKAEPRTAAYESDTPSAQLRDLLDLTEAGLAVVWPPGLDQRIARILLHERGE